MFAKEGACSFFADAAQASELEGDRTLDEPGSSTTAALAITVKDVNDEAPTFSRPSYSVRVNENIPVGSPLPNLDMFVQDTDAVVAEEAFTNPKLSSTATVTVNVLDINDNAPMFEEDSYTATVVEDASPGSVVTTIVATDRDTSPQGESGLMYSLLGNGADKFHVDPSSGVVTVAPCETPGRGNCLDFEARPAYFLSYQATDDRGRGQSAVVPLTVRLTDANDNPPAFEQRVYTALIDEGDAHFDPPLRVQARDPDVTSFIKYSIVSGNSYNLFTINPQTGDITVTSRQGLDVSLLRTDLITLTIQASDGGSGIDTAIVKITVRRLPLTRLDAHVLHIKVTLRMTTPGIFVLCRPQIIGVDGGVPEKTGTTTLSVNILNSNDKMPYFQPTTQRAQVSEGERNAFKNESAAYMERISLTNFAQQQQPPVRPTDSFACLSPTYASSLYHGGNNDFLYVDSKAISGLSSPRSPGGRYRAGTLVITIIDLNDFPPSFPPPWSPDHPELSISVMEEQPVGSVVASFVATDPDSNIASYSIEPENPYFAIDKLSGVVTIHRRVDYEQVQELQFSVVVRDTGVPQLSAVALVTATVTNINDNDPTFSQENAPQGTFVTRVEANDIDAGEFGVVSYSLVGEKSGDFHVNEKGEIRVAGMANLDREMTPTITLQVVATDMGHDTTTRRSVSVPVSATDADDGINAEIRYSIVAGNENGVLAVNPKTGIVYPVKKLESNRKEYRIGLEARDGAGTGPNTDNCVVLIRLIEINLDKPHFLTPSLPNATVQVLENQTHSSHIIMTVEALDKDQGDNGRISYYFKVGDRNVAETDEFRIDEVTGEIQAKVLLDRETRPRYELVLVAKDHGTPAPFETLRFLTVVLKDIDDNAPLFPRTQSTTPYVFHIKENLNPGFPVGKVTAIDQDVGENAMVYYYIIGLRFTAVEGDTVFTVRARDPDEEEGGTIAYRIEHVTLFLPGSAGGIRPIPASFNVSADGRVCATHPMAQYSQARFTVALEAKETTPPHRAARTTLKVWVYEPDQLVRVIIAQPPEEVYRDQRQVIATDLHIHVLDKNDRVIHTPEVLDAVDSNIKLVRFQNPELQIHNVLELSMSVAPDNQVTTEADIAAFSFNDDTSSAVYATLRRNSVSQIGGAESRNGYSTLTTRPTASSRRQREPDAADSHEYHELHSSDARPTGDSTPFSTFRPTGKNTPTEGRLFQEASPSHQNNEPVLVAELL
ncbi:hypothetical protein HPB48_001377 [Haemaphysalis longicornis]|uniref:Cadherin domain-containing protein n=1 Tax=Haemaphysalis longicornis TaxID=44386 RepID=A0A9J6FGI4_HAELO|nr:hypothetical protein HPB48_001377 [Haemaphysalis longicornis]